MAKKKKYNKKKVSDLASVLGMLGNHKGMFAGMRSGLKVGDKAIVLGKQVNMKGHAPASKYAGLSDGSKITLSGPNKGLIVR